MARFLLPRPAQAVPLCPPSQTRRGQRNEASSSPTWISSLRPLRSASPAAQEGGRDGKIKKDCAKNVTKNTHPP